MNIDAGVVKINGVDYVPAKSVINKAASDINGMPYMCVRTRSAGVFVGCLKSKKETVAGVETVLINARRLWYWSGAASLSQLVVDGVSNPSECKFPCSVDEVTLPESIEILPVSEKAKISIDSVKIWKA